MFQDLRSAQLQKEQIAHHFPGYKSKYIGILYGTSAIWPHLMVIPMRDWVEHLTHISHLKVSNWVDYFGPETFALLTQRGQKTYDVMADPMTNAPASGYTFFREHLTGFAPPNALIQEVSDIEDHAMDVTGNVLVSRWAL
ncbi:hypothetical protein BDR07DRAFT_1496430 [Suillus spraguei]|nr:hypothetical protein BDR07DRAFT_1496430 [Suillus spraguei]